MVKSPQTKADVGKNEGWLFTIELGCASLSHVVKSANVDDITAQLGEPSRGIYFCACFYYQELRRSVFLSLPHSIILGGFYCIYARLLCSSPLIPLL